MKKQCRSFFIMEIQPDFWSHDPWKDCDLSKPIWSEDMSISQRWWQAAWRSCKSAIEVFQFKRYPVMAGTDFSSRAGWTLRAWKAWTNLDAPLSKDFRLLLPVTDLSIKSFICDLPWNILNWKAAKLQYTFRADLWRVFTKVRVKLWIK